MALLYRNNGHVDACGHVLRESICRSYYLGMMILTYQKGQQYWNIHCFLKIRPYPSQPGKRRPHLGQVVRHFQSYIVFVD